MDHSLQTKPLERNREDKGRNESIPSSPTGIEVCFLSGKTQNHLIIYSKW